MSIKKGKLLGNNKLYGYNKKNNKLYINKKESLIIKEIFTLYGLHNKSTTYIRDYLNNKEIPTNYGNKWSTTTILRILRNPKYKGFYCANKSFTEDYMSKKVKYLSKKEWVMYKSPKQIPIIIEESLWNKVNNKLTNNSKHITKNVSIYTNKLICTIHNKPLYKRHNKYDTSWICSYHLHNKDNKCYINIKEQDITNILNLIISAVRSLIMIDTGAGFIAKLRQITFDKIQAMSISRINARTSGELINRVSSDCDTVKQFIVNDVGEMIQMVVTLVTVGVILFVYDWRLALLVLCPMPVIIFLNRYIRRLLHKFFHASWATSSTANSILHDTFSGIRVVKSFGMEKHEIERHRNITEKERDVYVKTQTYSGTVMPLVGFLMGIGEFFLMYYVGDRILGGSMTFGEMSKFSAYVSIIYGPLNWISRIPNIISRTGTSVAKVFDILDEENEVVDKEEAENIDIDGEVEFENVSFSYDITNPVLKNITATVKKGEMIGIVGRSGVGKSTLINLIMRLYDPKEGSVKVDGHDLRDIPQECLRSQIGVVLQETYLFSGTIYDNISYAKPEATRDEVIAAAKLAGAHKFIVKLPDGYNTKVGERGYSLSGGESQRVSIARALLRNPKILILDEATSALDTETEKEVQDVLYKLTRDRTTFAIAHRLSTLRNADKILVLDRGTIAEFDSHDELMKKRGIYYDLVMAQRQMSRMSKAPVKS